MSDNRKYYYLKLKADFFDSDSMVVMESMPDGYKYSNILLKLYLRSLKDEGKLMLNDRIPYNATMLAQVTRHSVGDVEKAVSIFSDLGLIELLDNGAIYMSDIQNFVGKSSTEADRKREYRTRIESEKTIQIGQMSDECPDKNPPEIEIEKELKIEKEIKKDSLSKPAKRVYDEDNTYFKLASELFESIKRNNPEAKKPNLQSWSDDIRKMVELDGRKDSQVSNMIEWSQSHDFWKGIILSAKKLREKYDQMKVQALQPVKQPAWKQQPKKEKMPEWAENDAPASETAPDPEQQRLIAERIARLKTSQKREA